MICVDASVAIKWLLPEERSAQAIALFDATLHTDQPIVGPPLLPLEVTNILRQHMRAQGGISLNRATEHLAAFLAFPIELHNPAGLHRQALVLADALGLPATYDAHYLALAEYLGCELWTDDQRLLRQVGGSLAYVRWIGDFPVAGDG